MIKYTLFLVMLISASTCGAQPANQNHEGNWEGILPDTKVFSFKILFEQVEANSFDLTIANNTASFKKHFAAKSLDTIRIDLDEMVQLTLLPENNQKELTGFIRSGILMYPVHLKKTGAKIYTGTWNPFMVDQLKSLAVFLGIEKNEDGTVAAYPFFGDQRFTGTRTMGFQKEGNTISFRDFKTGMKFRATLLKDSIQLEIVLLDATIATTQLSRSETDWNFGITEIDNKQNTDTPSSLNDGWNTENLNEVGINPVPLARMIDNIKANQFPNTHSVLIAREDKLVFEAYFDGYTANIPHDLRSASKSISSAMIGIAIDDQVLEGTDQKLYDCMPEAYGYTQDSLKSIISLHDLLTMSSGLDVSATASEGTYQNSANWLKTVLESEMVNPPGTYTDYGSANPFLLGVCLDERLEIPMEIYMEQKLLSPLAITNYIIQTEGTLTAPYFGGGMYLTPRDMLKFGQLYLNGGKWKGKQIIPEYWVDLSFQKYAQLQDVKDKNEYGYQWWHKTYIVDNTEIESIEARGNGGQYIFVIPELESTVVITSGNFRNRSLLQQPERILEEYLLPAIKN